MADSKSMPAEPDPHRNKRPKLGDKYAEIDKQINSSGLVTGGIGNASDLSDDQLSLLLFVIRDKSDGQISWKNTEQTFEKHRDLKDKLRAAWKAKSYQEILQLGYLQSSSGPGKSNLEDTTWCPNSLQKTKQVIKDAWKRPYRGDYHIVLLQKINAMYEPKAYKNICAIVQSSGTGKSRMVDELAKLVYTLPINIRETRGIYAAYPPSDGVLRDYLVAKAPNDEHDCRTHYETFFQCLFSHSLELLSNMHPLDNNLAGKWYDLMDDADYRRNFYEHVVNLCKSPTYNQSALKDLMTKLGACLTNKGIQMVIYIDEAHELKVRCGKCTKLDIMCSVISNFSEEPLFFLLLSTQSLLVPTRQAATFERARGTTGLAPFTETPFDCFLEDTIKPGVLHVEDLSTFEHVAKWGRPLWWTMADEGAEVLIGTAQMKLTCHHEIDRPLQVYRKDEALIAILDVLLALDFHELDEDTQAELVRSHMRIVYFVSHCDFQSGYPSEPLLAEAAAQQVLNFKKLDRVECFDAMASMLKKTQLPQTTNLVDAGQHGELFMRMCLMGAYMDSVLQELGSRSTRGIIFSKGCKLTTFIEQLFESNYARMVLDGRPNNVKSDTTFSQAFAKSMVRFTHFVTAGDAYQMTSEALFAAFIRGMAFVGYQTHQAVDFAIPVLLNKGDTLRESAMSAILIRVRRHVKGRDPRAHTLSEDEAGLFPPQAKVGESQGKGKGKAMAEEPLDDKRPYITLVAVGIGEPEKGNVNRIETPVVHVLQQPELIHYPDVHPRYAIVAYGCTSVYKHVAPDKYPFLFAARDLSMEHSDYGVARSRDLMMRLKPFWQRGENSYHWINSELSKKTK